MDKQKDNQRFTASTPKGGKGKEKPFTDKTGKEQIKSLPFANTIVKEQTKSLPFANTTGKQQNKIHSFHGKSAQSEKTKAQQSGVPLKEGKTGEKSFQFDKARQDLPPSGASAKAPKGGKRGKKDKEDKLKVIFLGGVGEIGKNMTLLEYGDDIIVVDCGVSFPTSETPGIDLIIPDMAYLKENFSKLRGILLTHGHEDHIGALPFAAKNLGHIDVYGSKLTLALAESKLIEHNVTDHVNKHSVEAGEKVQLGAFTVEFVRVTHSVAGSYALSITTPVGVVFHSGDFKVDYTPRHSLPMDLPRISQIGSNGVLLLLGESTNVEREGYTLSESVVADKFRDIFEEERDRRIIIATFSSNVDRLQEVFDLAKEFKRKVAVSGRSMINVIEMAGNLGYIKYDKNIMAPLQQVEKMKPGEVVILSTGTQGEPMSALTRMAGGEFNKVNVGSEDTIVISATPIPGNEKDIYSVINKLFRLGAKVVYSAIEDIHVSGHACKEELKLLHALVKPRFFIPVHGEYRHLSQHRTLALELGMNKNSVVIAEIGDVAEVSQNRIALRDKVPSGNVLIDGNSVGDVGNDILRDRLSLAEDGIVIISCGVEGGIVTAKPQVFSRGSFYTKEGANTDIVEEIKQISFEVLESSDLKKLDLQSIKGNITKQVRAYFKRKFKRFPMILVIIMSSALEEQK